jgi:archaeosine-15-forming tRNA-guanine transglycosylase
MYSQVTIGSTSDPDDSAVLDLSKVAAQNLGLLLPRVQLTADNDDRTVAVSATTAGLMVYNIGGGGLEPAGVYVWNGTKWVTTGVDSSSDYALALTPRTLNFAPTTYNTTLPAAQTVTAYNFGNQPTGALSYGGVASNYAISAVSNIVSDGNAAFTVRPNSGLDAGSYSGTITVGNANVPEKEISVTYTVNQATPVITFADFSAALNTQSVNPGATVSPTSLQSSLVYSLASANSIGVTTNGTTVSAGSTAGTAAIRVSTAGNTNYASASKDAIFTVKAATGAGTSTMGSTTYNTTPPAAQTVTAYNFGNQPTGVLSYGGAASNYTISAVSNIVSDGNAAFTVRPNSGLNAGSYSGTITVGNAT